VSALFVAAGAAVGAPLRWWVDRLVQQRWAPAMPWGTFTVNVAGSLVLGALTQAVVGDSSAFLLIGIGFCGALTTFSSFTWETYRLVEDGANYLAVLNVAASLVVCVLAAWVGWVVAGSVG